MPERIGIVDARSLPARDIKPCGDCDLKPAACDKQQAVNTDGGFRIICRLGKGFIQRITPEAAL